MTEDFDPVPLSVILGNVGAEICEPLDTLRDALGSIVAEPEVRLPPQQQAHAATMIALCEELGRLTRETFGSDGSIGTSN